MHLRFFTYFLATVGLHFTNLFSELLFMYRVFKLDMIYFERLLGYLWMNFCPDYDVYYVHEMRTFDLFKKKIKNSTLLASMTSERKVANSFTGSGRGAPMILQNPYPSGSKKLNIRAFKWGIVGFCTKDGFTGKKLSLLWMLTPPGFYHVKKTREVAFWTFIRRQNHKPLSFFDIIKPRRGEHS